MRLKLIGDAGTGKTYTLLRYADTFNAVIISHTTTAVNEFIEKRKANNVKNQHKSGRLGNINARTLHSLACSTLYNKDKKFRELFKNTDRAGGIENIRARFCKIAGLPYSPDPYTPDAGKTFFSRYSKAVNIYYPNPIPSNDGFSKHTLELITAYEEFKLERGYIDYEDMLKWIYKKADLLPEMEAVIIDEAQDLSPLQWKIIQQMESEYVIAAGDELQAIFGFQGAKPDLFRNFNARTRIFPKTFRIPKTIWDFAGEIVKKQIKRKRAKAAEEGGEVRVTAPMTLQDIATVVTAVTASKTLVLFRHNADVLKFSSILQEKNIEHELIKESIPEYELNPPVFSEGIDLKKPKRILIDTIHAAKGMEAPVVFLVDGIRKRSTAASKETSEMEVEEEERVWYVGATRAKKSLIIIPLKEDGIEHFVTPIASDFLSSINAYTSNCTSHRSVFHRLYSILKFR